MDSKIVRPGLTIIEILVAFVLVGIVSTMVASIFLAHFKLFSNQGVSFDIATQNSLAIDTITNEIRESQGAALTCPNPPCNPAETSGGGVLVLQLWQINASGEPQAPGANYDYIVFKLDPLKPTNLQRKVAPGTGSSRAASTKIIAGNISDLNFTYQDSAGATVAPNLATSVSISVTTTGTANGKTQNVTRTSIGTLRNKP